MFLRNVKIKTWTTNQVLISYIIAMCQYASRFQSSTNTITEEIERKYKSWLINAQWHHRFGQHWLRLWLSAWRHKTITWTNVDLSSVRFSGIHLRVVSYAMPQASTTKVAFQINHLKFNWNLQGYIEVLQRVSVRPCLILLQVTACRLAAVTPYLKHCSSKKNQRNKPW